jgi:putative salt-induced outer membrane protein
MDRNRMEIHMTARALPTLFLLAALALPAAAPAAEPKLGWADAAELSYVATGGNAEAETLGFRNLLTRTWTDARFSLEAAGLRADTTTKTFVVEGTFPDFRVIEVEDSKVTAENYLLRARYEHDFAGAWYGFGGAGWERNKFAGFDNRTSVVGGAGRTWFADGDDKLRTDLGLSYTREESTFRVRSGTRLAEVSDEWLGARFTADYAKRLTATTTLTNLLLVDQNLDDTEDLRADMTTAVAVKMSENLALKASLQLLFDNQPGLIGVTVPGAPGSGGSGRVVFERDELDHMLSVSLVVNL